MSIKSSKSNSSSTGSSLDFFEGQKDSKCGVHALNNLYRNYDGPSFIKNLFFTHGLCKAPRGLEVSRRIDVDAICKTILKKKLLGKEKKEQKSIKANWECSSEGNYRIEILEKAIVETGIDIIDYSVQLTNVELQDTDAARDEFYLQLKAKANNRGLLGFLVQNKDYGGHYVAVLPKNGKLLWVDSADNWKSEKIENRPLKDGKWSGFRYLTRKKFRALLKEITLVYELLDIATVEETEEE